MSRIEAFIETERFDRLWPDNYDPDPPPGKDFASELFNIYHHHPATSTCPDEMADDDWEHTAWFMFVKWRDEKNEEQNYSISIECALDQEPSGLWRVGLKRHGPLLSIPLFRRKKPAISEEFRTLTDKLLRGLTKPTWMQWYPAEKADAIWEFVIERS